MQVLLDVRHRVPSGISTYAVNIAGPVIRELSYLGHEAVVVAEHHQREQVRGFDAEVLIADVCEQYVHFSDALLDQVARRSISHAHSFGPLIDPRWATSWSFTQHDLVRERTTALQYSDRQIFAQHGPSEVARMLAFVDWCDSHLDDTSLGHVPGQAHRSVLRNLAALGQQHSSFIVTLSPVVARELRSNWHLPHARVRVVPPVVQELTVSRALENLPQDARFLLFVGTPDHHKRLDLVCSILDRAGSTVPIVVVGDNEPGRLGARIDAYTTSSLLEGARILRMGRVDAENLSWLYQHAIATVVPSLAEGFCLPALECAQLGGRLIVNDIPVLRATLSGFENVDWFDISTPHSLCKSLGRAMQRYEAGEGVASAGSCISSRANPAHLLARTIADAAA